MMSHFGAKVRLIESCWNRASGLMTNLDLFNSATRAGLSPEQAALIATKTGQWADDGSKTATERASGIWRSELKRYVAPARDPAVVEALDAYVARRMAEGGAPPVT